MTGTMASGSGAAGSSAPDLVDGEFLARLRGASPLRFFLMVRSTIRAGAFATLIECVSVKGPVSLRLSRNRKLALLCEVLHGSNGTARWEEMLRIEAAEHAHLTATCRRAGLGMIRRNLEWSGFSLGEPGEAGRCTCCRKAVAGRRVYRRVTRPPRATERVYCRGCTVRLMTESNPVWRRRVPSEMDMAQEDFWRGGGKLAVACRGCGVVVPGAEAFRYEPWVRDSWPVLCFRCAVEEMAELNPVAWGKDFPHLMSKAMDREGLDPDGNPERW
jgi:hypothetical protein